MNVRYRVELSQDERDELSALLSRGKHAARKLKRAQIPLAANAGAGDEDIAISVAVGGSTVYRRQAPLRPPEDCGGFPGYYEFLDNIAGPDKRQGQAPEKGNARLVACPYDPDNIDEAQIRSALKRIANARPRGQSKPVNA